MKRLLCLTAALYLCVTPSIAAEVKADGAGARALTSYDSRFHPVIAKHGMVSAQDRIAAEVGRDILARGGNAVDAAVATGFALAVTHPQAGNLGGGGFMVVHLADENKQITIDFREMAPSRASRDMFIGPDGEVDNARAQYSHLSAGVPGTVMGMLDALDAYGTMTRREVIGPAAILADRGFDMPYALVDSLNGHREEFSADPSSLKYFFKAGGVSYAPGERFKQKDLAQTLRRIIKKGSDGFYTGETADLIVSEMAKGGGLMTYEDLNSYKTVMREPVRGNYKGYEIVSMPPPSSGGVHVIQMLNMLSQFDLKADGHNSAAYLHKLTEAMRRAFADRSKFLGDPDFADVPTQDLIDPGYNAAQASSINLDLASKSKDIAPAVSMPYESPQTTHYSVIDKHGNAVAVTYTLNFSYGSGYTVDGAGFLLNNEMDDFSAKPGAPNGYGLIGGAANAIEPGKRPLSSMTPLIVTKDGKAVLVTGSPGGSTIINSVLQMVLNVIEWDMNLAQATAMPKIHHQWLPDVVVVEPGINIDTLRALEARGFNLVKNENGGFATTVIGRVNSVAQGEGFVFGAADPRGPKSAAIGH
ncbi:gamma-glutamyltransferase [Fretibacter rubidus]|uniref:gamma-glutamyltransferase n=1 Tax=Fretibacter rubidus TaxID=570162 RepID=UPI00352A6ADC